MKALQIFTVACLVVFIVLFFSKCKPGGSSTGGGLVYNRDSAKVHIIPVDDAIQLTTNFKIIQKENARRLRDSSYIVEFPLAEKFNRDAILAVLDQKGAKGVR